MFKKSQASILIFTLLMLSVLTVLTQQLVRSVLINYSFSTHQLNSVKAKQLALGGVNLAISQLLDDNKSKENSSFLDKNVDKPNNKFRDFLSRVLPNINRWQIFKLNEKTDFIDGEVGFCISCENGKININNAFDFKKEEFKKDYQNILKGLEIKGKLKAGQILKELTEYFKKTKKPLNDISELVNVKGLENISIFYDPPRQFVGKGKNKPNDEIYLQDLFSTWNENSDLEFLFLSDSLLNIFGLRRPLADDSLKFKDKFKSLINSINKDYPKFIKDDWNKFYPIYGKKSKQLALFESLLSKEFGSKVYSVLSYGKVNGVEERLLAVLVEVEKKREKESKKDSAKEQILAKKQEEESSNQTFQIVRMYWI